jgi:hypothetical protein
MYPDGQEIKDSTECSTSVWYLDILLKSGANNKSTYDGFTA